MNLKQMSLRRISIEMNHFETNLELLSVLLFLPCTLVPPTPFWQNTNFFVSLYISKFNQNLESKKCFSPWWVRISKGFETNVTSQSNPNLKNLNGNIFCIHAFIPCTPTVNTVDGQALQFYSHKRGSIY